MKCQYKQCMQTSEERKKEPENGTTNGVFKFIHFHWIFYVHSRMLHVKWKLTFSKLIVGVSLYLAFKGNLIEGFYCKRVPMADYGGDNDGNNLFLYFL